LKLPPRTENETVYREMPLLKRCLRVFEWTWSFRFV